MKKLLPIILILYFASIYNIAQNSTEKMGDQDFKRVLNQQFTNLITGQSKNSIGNFASLDLSDAEISFAGSFISQNGSVLTIKLNGGITDGLFSIFNNSKLNTNISLELQYNLMDLAEKSLTYYNDSFEKYINKRGKIIHDYINDSISIVYKQPLISLLQKEKKFTEVLKKISKEIKETTIDSLKKYNLRYTQVKTKLQLDSIKTAINNYDGKDLLDEAQTSRNKKLKELKPDIEIYGFKLGWFSIAYKVKNNSFKLFNPSVPFDSQIVKTNFISHELRFQCSKYEWSSGAYQSYFYCIGTAFTFTDNFSELTKTAISEVKNYGSNVNDRRTIAKYDAYIGNYKKDIIGVRFYGDYYRFLFKHNIAALHIYPELQLKEKEELVFNTGIGFLFSFKDTKDETSVVNAELYYNFLNIFNVNESDYKLLERNNIGIRFSFPIKFKTK